MLERRFRIPDRGPGPPGPRLDRQQSGSVPASPFLRLIQSFGPPAGNSARSSRGASNPPEPANDPVRIRARWGRHFPPSRRKGLRAFPRNPVPRSSSYCTSRPLRSLADGHNLPRLRCNEAVQHGELPYCLCLRTDLFTLPPLPLLTDRDGVPTLPNSHYSHNDVALVARFCYGLGGGLRNYLRRIPCSTICARS